RVLELAHALPHRLTDLREALGAEEQEGQQKEEDDLPGADVGHALRVARLDSRGRETGRRMARKRPLDEQVVVHRRRLLRARPGDRRTGAMSRTADTSNDWWRPPVASALSYRVLALQSAYCASKAALRTFFESARVELEKERSGVDGSVILPGRSGSSRRVG